jgi:predicted DNA-binding antitoxin AbrB/MazE fold protein
MYENGIMKPVETVLRRGRREIKEKDGGGESY